MSEEDRLPMDDHDFTDIETLAGLYDCVRDLVAERDRLRAVVDAARDLVLKDNEHWSAYHAPLVVALAALDGSEATDDR